MTRPSPLPDLPLMLAGVPRPVRALLHAAGLPVEFLPPVTLLASGSGRFLLFDSHSPASVAQSRTAASQGLIPLDLRALSEQADWPESSEMAFDATASAAAGTFLERLKLELEQRGGIWLRISDYPFPYQSAIAISVEHRGGFSDDLAGIARALPQKVTHFVTNRLRGAALAPLVGGSIELGWRIVPEDCELSRHRTAARWEARLDRFRGAGLGPRGLFLAHPELPLPSIRSLGAMGWNYDCRIGSASSCRIEPAKRSRSIPSWVHFQTVPLPPREAFVEYIGDHDRSGCPLFVTASTEQADLARDLGTLISDAARCSLMWHTSLSEFESWQRLRRQLRLQVWRREGGCEIHANGDFCDALWGLEIWRGNHLAAIPFGTRELFVPDDGLVYLHAMKRTPGGCVLSSPRISHHCAPDQPVAA
jgi:hypothetical protein